jgi:hypothetical protein
MCRREEVTVEELTENLMKYGSEPPTGKSTGVGAATAHEAAHAKQRFREGIVEEGLYTTFKYSMQACDLGKLELAHKLLSQGKSALLVLRREELSMSLENDDLITSIYVCASEHVALDLSVLLDKNHKIRLPTLEQNCELSVEGMRFQFDQLVVQGVSSITLHTLPLVNMHNHMNYLACVHM